MPCLVRLRPHGDDLVGGRRFLGEDDLGVPVLPLADQELPDRGTGVLPLERPEDRVDRVLAQPVGERELIVDAADALDRRLETWPAA